MSVAGAGLFEASGAAGEAADPAVEAVDPLEGEGPAEVESRLVDFGGTSEGGHDRAFGLSQLE